MQDTSRVILCGFPSDVRSHLYMGILLLPGDMFQEKSCTLLIFGQMPRGIIFALQVFMNSYASCNYQEAVKQWRPFADDNEATYHKSSNGPSKFPTNILGMP